MAFAILAIRHVYAAILAALAKLADPAIKDAYEGLKAIIKRKFGAHHEVVQAVENLEKKPDSIGRREMLKEELVGSGADAEAEIVEAARSLLENLKKQPGVMCSCDQRIPAEHWRAGHRRVQPPNGVHDAPRAAELHRGGLLATAYWRAD